MDEREICFLDVGTLRRLYRRGELSPVDVTEATLNRISRLDDELNAFITVLRDSALEQARRAETELQQGVEGGPLHGVPLSLKDLFDTAGVRTTAGSPIWRDRVPDGTATAARRLMDAGCILLGKCNMLEFAYGIVHPDYGQCNNPWDIRRTSGGSSSGSAASVSAGMGWGSLGTDTGGSIRIPASYCGVVGFKPSYGRVSRHGVYPLSWSLDHVGPIARTVEDVAILLQTIAGVDPKDPTTSRSPVPDYRASLRGDVSELKLGVLVEHLDDGLAPGVGEAVEEAIAELERAGMSTQPVHMASLKEADPALLLALMPEATAIHEDLLREHASDYAEGTRSQLELGALIPAVDYVRSQQFRSRLLREFLEVLEDVDLLVSPTAPWEAPLEDPEVAAGEGFEEARRTGPYNLTGLPAITVPCGFGKDGLPVGLQIAAGPMEDELVLRAAYAYEQRAGWYRRHPTLD